MDRRSRLPLLPVVVALAVLLPGCGPEYDVVVEEQGIVTVSATEGSGRIARTGDLVCIDYRLRLPDGAEILEDTNFCFHLGQGAVIGGLDEAVKGMRSGGRRTVLLPPNTHWGRAGYGDKVPPLTTLTLEVHVRSIE